MPFRFTAAIPANLAAILLIAASVPAMAQSFESCLAGIRSEAAGKGVSGATFDRVMAA